MPRTDQRAQGSRVLLTFLVAFEAGLAIVPLRPTLAAAAGVGAGDQEVCADPPLNGVDQRGFVRPSTGHTPCSIGAYEADALPPEPCSGDCDGDRVVTVDELILGVNIVLEMRPVGACSAFANSEGVVDIAQLIMGVNSALEGCPVCGNGRLEGDETCDDGNRVGGDGCAANCTGEDRRTYLIAGGTCVGGLNDGASCQTQDDCPGGVGPTPCDSATVQAGNFAIPLLLAGQEVLTTGRARASDPNGTLPVVIKAADVHFDPVRLVGVECVCVRAVALEAFGAGNAGVGEIGCGPSGLPDIDVDTSRDHDIRSVDPTCATGTPDPDTDACIGPLTVNPSGGAGPRGSAVIRLKVEVEEFPGSGSCAIETTTRVCQGGPIPGRVCNGETCGVGGQCVPAKGPDGEPCSGDEPAEVTTAATLVVTTGSARGEVLNANAIPGKRIGVGSDCSALLCRAAISGTPFDCEALAANPSGGVSGARLVSAFPFIGTFPVSDTVTTGLVPLLGLPKLCSAGNCGERTVGLRPPDTSAAFSVVRRSSGT